MRDAIGGVMNLVIIVVFMVIVSGYLAFNVNYTKAFRVKNKIISTYEQYNGNCSSDNSPCRNQIRDYMTKIGYDKTQQLKIKDYDCRDGYCALYVPGVKDSNSYDDRERYYYKIVTQITIDLPIINRVMRGLKTFQINGDTKTFIKRK